MAMRVARAWGVSPTVYLEQWSERDRGLAEGSFLETAGLCPCGCGYPAKLTQDHETEGWWQVEEVICYARQAIEDDKGDGVKDEPGLMRHAVLDPAYESPPLDQPVTGEDEEP